MDAPVPIPEYPTISDYLEPRFKNLNSLEYRHMNHRAAESVFLIYLKDAQRVPFVCFISFFSEILYDWLLRCYKFVH